MSENLEQTVKHINALYSSAKTEQEYDATIEAGKKLESMLEKRTSEYYEAMIEGLNFYWSRYYKLLKFDPSNKIAANQLLSEIDNLYLHCDDARKIAKILYLEIVVLANLLNDTESAEAAGKEMKELFQTKELVWDDYLRYINAMGIKAMAEAKNLRENNEAIASGIKWREAIVYFSEILGLPEENLDSLESPETAANVFSNLAATLLRANLNLDDAVKRLEDIRDAKGYLYLAELYYNKMKPPSAKHLQGVTNRYEESLREEEKLKK